MGAKKLPFTKESKFEKEIEKGSSIISWSWNDEKGICKIKLSKNADVNLSIIHQKLLLVMNIKDDFTIDRHGWFI